MRAIVVSALFLSQVLAPGQDGPVFESESNLVPIYAQVVDEDTHQPIGGLTRKDFIILDEGKPVDLGLFDSSPAAVNLVLLLDLSGLSRNEGILFTTDAFLQLRELDDRYALISFSDGKAQRRTGLTDNEGELQDARNIIFRIDNPRAKMKTSRLFDAIQEGIHALKGEAARPRHSAIVVITHDREAHSKVTKSALMAALLDSGITVDAITIPQEVPTPYSSMNIGVFPGVSIQQHARGPYVPTYLNDLHSVDKIVAATGGLAVPLKFRNAHRASAPGVTDREWDVDKIAKILDDSLMIQLRTQYQLGIYNPSIKERQYHRLQVRLSESAQQKHPSAVVHARAGYYTGVQEAPKKKP